MTKAKSSVVVERCPRNKENGNIFQSSREFGIKLHGTKRAQSRNGICANWNIHPREQGDSLNIIGTLC